MGNRNIVDLRVIQLGVPVHEDVAKADDLTRMRDFSSRGRSVAKRPVQDLAADLKNAFHCRPGLGVTEVLLEGKPGREADC